MANFKFSYVRSFEPNDRLAPDQWIVISLENNNQLFKEQVMQNKKDRLKFTDLMNKNALDVMEHFKDIRFSYVHSTSAHFVFDGTTTAYQRRSSKLVSYVASCLASTCILNWPKFLDFPMNASPCFEGKIFVFPNDQHLRDYFTLSQMNHHLVNLRQTLVEAINGDNSYVPSVKETSHSASTVDTNKQAGEVPGEKNQTDDSTNPISNCADPAEDNTEETAIGSYDENNSEKSFSEVCDLQTEEKEKMLAVAAVGTEAYCNEQLYAQFRINYNNEPKILKKGTFLMRQKTNSKMSKKETKGITLHHEDHRKNAFWDSLSLLTNETSFNAKFFMIPKFQRECSLTPDAWIVVRLDGKAFHKLAQVHKFRKPNDIRAIELMNLSAAILMKSMPDIVLAYGESDEYSFVFHRYSWSKRNSDALVSQCVSIFSAAYVQNWPFYFGGKPSVCEDSIAESPSNEGASIHPEFLEGNKTDYLEENERAADSQLKEETVESDSRGPDTVCASEGMALKLVPIFDGRAIMYPTTSTLRDYLSWRQADCHVNNMYNTAFWSLVQKEGYSRADAEKKLNGTYSKDKRQILLDMGMDYDEEPAIHRKGSVIYRLHKSRRTKSRNQKKGDNTVRNYIWWTEECENIKQTRNEQRKKYYNSFSEQVLCEYLKANIEYCRVIKKAKLKHKLESEKAAQSKVGIVRLQDSASSPEGGADSSLLTLESKPELPEGGADGGSLALESKPELPEGGADGGSLALESKPELPEGGADGGSLALESKSELPEGEADSILLALVSKLEPLSFEDEEIVIPENFVSDFEKRLDIASIVDPEERNKILNNFNKKGKSWWSIECHMAKSLRFKALLAYKREPSAETERAHHLAFIRFIAIVRQSKPRKRNAAKLLNKSSKENSHVLGEEQGASCVQTEEVVDASVDALDEWETNFDDVLENSEETISNKQVDVKSESELLVQETGHEEIKSEEKIHSNEIQANQDTDITLVSDGAAVNSEGQGHENLVDKNLSSSGISTEDRPRNVPLRRSGRLSEHVFRFGSLGRNLVLCFDDIIDNHFWRKHPHILGCEKSALLFEENS